VPRFYVENFGCRATQADGAAIERQFEQAGLERAPAASQAEIVVLNTCTVTTSADRDARAAIRRIHRSNPACQIVVTGCYAQRAPQEIAALPGVSQVIGNSHKHELARLISPAVTTIGTRSPAWDDNSFLPLSSLTAESQEPTTKDQGPIFVSDIFAHTELLAAPVFEAANERTRPNLKIQDGCDNRCSFCVIPYVRGQSRSLPLQRVLQEIDTLVAAGYREVVISGINLGRWGRDLDRSQAGNCDDIDVVIPGAARDLQFASRETTASHSLLGMTGQLGLEYVVRAILEHTSLEKLRISSVEPMDWSDSLIRLMSESRRVARHAHVPMQSGSDRILRAMHRKYRPWHYREKIERIRAAMPEAAIGADVMVGFPGESESDFDETRRMVEELPFTYLHVFTYSARPGTPAASMSNQVPVQIARERNRVLRELAAEKKLAFMRSFVARPVQAITLNVFDGIHTEALTDNYLKLRLHGPHAPNQWIRAQVEQVAGGALVGVAVQS
jgi:threonylcarbamoyladenosine tRNA methylthiotransferase MtaB